MNNVLYLFLSLFLQSNIMIAEPPANSEMGKNSLYLEVGTNLLISTTSVNFEAYIGSSEKVHWYLRGGFGTTSIAFTGGGGGGLGALTMLTGAGKHHFETSAGIFISPALNSSVLPLLDLGYRFQNPEGGFVFRGKVGTLGVGVGIGYAF
ncbi:MAG: hypothetical protein NZ735_06880 [Candidatus Marinimicrobia bacterium]|nr:hypothetical protein [Candidatus Neomarinimicrobiota bacterium]